jgi:hypothetical protein
MGSRLYLEFIRTGSQLQSFFDENNCNYLFSEFE